MQNPVQQFRQSSIVFEKPDFLSEEFKILTSSNYHKVQYFLLTETSHTFPTYQCLQKLIIKVNWVNCKNKKRPGFYTLVFYIFINNLRSKQNK